MDIVALMDRTLWRPAQATSPEDALMARGTGKRFTPERACAVAIEREARKRGIREELGADPRGWEQPVKREHVNTQPEVPAGPATITSQCQACAADVAGRGMIGIQVAEQGHLAGSKACVVWGRGRSHQESWRRRPI